MLNPVEVLNQFNPINLAEMDSVKLMERTDTKYVFSIQQLFFILEKLKENYLVLDINGKRVSAYKTLYYDTENLSLYKRHHNGINNRYKIRHRTYVDSNLGFLEVKYKNNKGRTFKKRINNPEVPENFYDVSDSLSFLEKQLPFSPTCLIPSVWVNYRRITLVSLFTKERATIDLDLEFVKNNNHKLMNGLVILEVKQDGKNESLFLTLMRDNRIKPGSISKYCMAIATTDETVKQNNFKKKLLSINKIMNK